MKKRQQRGRKDEGGKKGEGEREEKIKERETERKTPRKSGADQLSPSGHTSILSKSHPLETSSWPENHDFFDKLDFMRKSRRASRELA